MSLLDELAALELDEGLWIDLASVSEGLRDFGLLHAPLSSSTRIDSVLEGCRMTRIHSRRLRRSQDSASQDGVLASTESSAEPREDDWIEIWFARSTRVSVGSVWLETHTGAALGYPDCCVAQHQQRRPLAEYYSDSVFSQEPRCWEINRLAALFTRVRVIPDFLPCKLSCESARAIGARGLSLACTLFGEARAAEWMRVLQAPLTVWEGSLVRWPNWRLDGAVLHVETRGVVSRKLSSIAQMNCPSWIHARSPWLVPFQHFGTVCELQITNMVGSVSKFRFPEKVSPRL